MKTFDAFEAEFMFLWNSYAELYDRLDKYRGKELDGMALDDANKILNDIQDTFHAMYPGISFVIQRYQVCAKALTDYQTFIDQLKLHGATEVTKN